MIFSVERRIKQEAVTNEWIIWYQMIYPLHAVFFIRTQFFEVRLFILNFKVCFNSFATLYDGKTQK